MFHNTQYFVEFYVVAMQKEIYETKNEMHHFLVNKMLIYASFIKARSSSFWISKQVEICTQVKLKVFFEKYGSLRGLSALHEFVSNAIVS